MLSNSRGPDTLAEVVASIEGNVRAGTVAVAIPPRAILDLPLAPFAGKIVVDANNYFPEFHGQFPELAADQITARSASASTPAVRSRSIPSARAAA